MGYRLGVDVGGTFTDLVMMDEETGRSLIGKVPSTPHSPDGGVLNGIRRLVDESGISADELSFLIHGTTVATNALIERTGASVALVTTQGFRDVLHIGRQTRPSLYDFRVRRPDPLIPRHLRFEVLERVLHTGQVMIPLDEESVRQVARGIAQTDVGMVVVCLINSYANPSHEVRVREILAEELPGVRCSISTEVLPEFKEYERMSTTAINAYVMPIIESYLGKIRSELDVMGVTRDLHIMQSNGGVMTSQTASRMSVHTVLSGPAAGALGAVMLARMIGVDNTINIDMGGTSFDVSLAYKGELDYSTENDIAGHITKVPMIDIKTLGAGGGSIAWIDSGGALQVGPRSAGADPGPVCYQRGGTEPTVSDANALLGYLNPDYLAGGHLKLDKGAAARAIDEKIAKPLGMSVEQAAVGIIKVVNATMIKGIRIVSVERGYDPRRFALVSFGGAGPVHAVTLAREMDIPKVIVPTNPGIACATGLLMADFRHDYVQTFLAPVSKLDVEDLCVAYAGLERKAVDQMTQENVRRDEIVLNRTADMRYVGQGYTLEVNVPLGDIRAGDLAGLADDFHRVHERDYGYRMTGHDVEFVNLRVVAIGLLPKPRFDRAQLGDKSPAKALKGHRSAYMDGGFSDVPVYERTELTPGNRLEGPAIVEQLDSTTVVLPGCEVLVDAYRNLIITDKVDSDG